MLHTCVCSKMKVPSDIKVTSDQGSHTSNAQVTLSTTATFCVIYRFLSRGSTLARDIDIAILYVRPSVRLSVTFRD